MVAIDSIMRDAQFANSTSSHKTCSNLKAHYVATHRADAALLNASSETVVAIVTIASEEAKYSENPMTRAIVVVDGEASSSSSALATRHRDMN